LDEIRVSNIARSSDWIATEYNNQSSPATFYSMGSVGQSPALITSVNSTTFAVGSAGSFAVTATGLPVPIVSESGNLPSGISFNAATGILSGTPATGSVGSYPITFTAHNGVGADASQSFTLTVNQPSAITSSNGTVFTVATVGSFSITATGFPAPTVSESGTLPPGVTFSSVTGMLSGTPANGAAGAYPIALTAHNGVGPDASQNFTLTVQPPPLTGYSHSSAITIDHTKVPNTDQSNFPVLVSGTYSYLATTNNGGGVTNQNGYDIAFASDAAGNNPLFFEQETYNSGSGTIKYWVRLPTVSHTTDTVFYIFYGNSGVSTDQSSKSAVWDSNYIGVWHMEDNAASAVVKDSTSNGNNGTASAQTSSKTTTGEIDKALSFNGINDGISTGITGSAAFTWEGWVNSASMSNYSSIITIDGPSFMLMDIYGGAASFWTADGVYGSSLGIAGLNNGTWYHLVFSRSGDYGSYKAYLNGSFTGQAAGGIWSSAQAMSIGWRADVGQYFDGLLDEIRVSNIARSSDWIATEYNNQSSPATFYSMGSVGQSQSPSAVTNLTAITSGTQISLSWAASTETGGTISEYQVERCQGVSCTTFVQIATPSATGFSDTGLATGTYSYRVRAEDVAGNLSSYSTVVTAVIPDTQAPTAPTGLTATASGEHINLAWTASTDNVAVTGYLVERCQGSGCTTFAQVTSITTITYNDSLGLLSSTTYSYRVRATDAAGNLSLYSNVASATTAAVTPIAVSPQATALTFTRTQQFTTTITGVTWSVDGIAGGTTASGTITTAGDYTPPSSIGTHTIEATSSDQTQVGYATVYVTNYPGTFTHHNDNLRTGQNLSETVLTTANVNATKFGKLATYQLDGVAYASPLYVANVNIPGQGFHNVVYVATEHDSVYAFDADALSTNPIWKVSFINASAGITTVPAADTLETGDIYPEVGITSTPVIDPTSGTIYVVANTKEPSGYVQRLHVLDITTGAEKFGGPAVIQASVTGTGDGAQAGLVSFDALRENQRPALLLNNGVVYIAAASHGDNDPYHGWVLGYNATTLQQVMVYNTTPNGGRGGVWQSGGGVAADSDGNLYVVTGNGDFDANTGGNDYGESYVKLSPSGIVLDYFTPHDPFTMNEYDLDLGSAGLILLPDQPGTTPRLVGNAGKGGTIYLVNRSNMGKYNSQNDNQIVQSLANIFPNPTNSTYGGNFICPVYFNGFVYFSPVTDKVKAFQISNGLLSTAPTSVSSTTISGTGAALAISANGSTNGILWAVERVSSYTDDLSATGVLHAYDASNLATQLYNSNQAGSRDTLDYAAKYNVPLVANGKVFVANVSELVIYGLLP